MAGTVTETITKYDVHNGVPDKVVASFACVGDASNGSVPDTALSTTLLKLIRGMYLSLMVTKPGTPNPTAAYDITLVNAASLDILGGSGANRSASAAEQVMPLISSSAQKRLITEALTLKVANQSVNSAQYTIELIFTRN
jgi:hypothetical protein